jgi:hypothetical protein
LAELAFFPIDRSHTELMNEAISEGVCPVQYYHWTVMVLIVGVGDDKEGL